MKNPIAIQTANLIHVITGQSVATSRNQNRLGLWCAPNELVVQLILVANLRTQTYLTG